jgi:stage II sporulation protein Q
MNEPNKGIQVKEETTPTSEGASAAVPAFRWRRLMAKKWAFPAMYMVAAAIILTIMWVYQDSGKNMLTDAQIGADLSKSGKTVSDAVNTPEALSVIAAAESMRWPVKDRGELEVTLPFYDAKASNEVRQAAMVEYEDTFSPHLGIDFARRDNQTFDILASLSGKVTNVDKHPVVGNLIEITHSNGLVTIYQSVSDIKVVKGADVKKGDVIAKAGRNELEKDEGIHVHFEVRQSKDGTPLNPEQFIMDSTR